MENKVLKSKLISSVILTIRIAFFSRLAEKKSIVCLLRGS